MTSITDEWTRLETLAAQCASGDREAWSVLMMGMEPKLRALVRRQKIGRLKARDDDLRTIVVRVFEKLRANDFRVLRTYFAYDSRPKFRTWIGTVLRTTSIDHLRTHPEYRRTPEDDQDKRWVTLATLKTGAMRQGADSIAVKRQRVLTDLQELSAEAARAHTERGADAYAELARSWQIAPLHVKRLVTKGELYYPTFNLALQGYSYPEIAERFDITRREVELLVQYAEELLQAKYRTRPDDPPAD